MLASSLRKGRSGSAELEDFELYFFVLVGGKDIFRKSWNIFSRDFFKKIAFPFYANLLRPTFQGCPHQCPFCCRPQWHFFPHKRKRKKKKNKWRLNILVFLHLAFFFSNLSFLGEGQGEALVSQGKSARPLGGEEGLRGLKLVHVGRLVEKGCYVEQRNIFLLWAFPFLPCSN